MELQQTKLAYILHYIAVQNLTTDNFSQQNFKARAFVRRVEIKHDLHTHTRGDRAQFPNFDFIIQHQSNANSHLRQTSLHFIALFAA